VLILASALYACGGSGGGDGGGATPPRVSAVTPADGAVDVAPKGEISATFSTAMDCASLSAASFTLVDGLAATVDGHVACSGNGATFTPVGGFPEATTLTATFTTGVRASAGTALAANYTWSFTTRARAWGTAALLESRDANAAQPVVAFAPDGSALAVWVEKNAPWDILAARYTPDGGWGAAEVLDSDPANDAYDPHLFVDASGNAFAVWKAWESEDNIWVNRYVAGQGWQGAERLEANTNGAEHPSIAFDAQGNALAVWDAWDGSHSHIWSRYFDADTGWAAQVPTETSATGDNTDPTVTFAGDGTVVAAWDYHDPVKSRDDLYSAVYTPGTGWAAPFIVDTDDTGGAFASPIATDGKGNVMVVWRQYDGTNYPVFARRYLPGFGWEATTHKITDGGVDTSGTEQPSFALDANGNALAVWVQLVGATRDVMASRYSADGSWETPVTLDDSATEANHVTAVVIDRHGSALAVWSQGTAIFANRYTASAWSNTPTSLGGVSTMAPAIALSPKGDVIAVWKQNDGSYDNVMFSLFE
jgi:hypothetical protein